MLVHPAFARIDLRRLPHWFALFAVLVQLVASYGHMHPEDYRFLLRGHAAPMLHAGNGPTGGSSPVVPVDDSCPICAAAQLLGSSTLPDAVVLPMPRLETVVAAPAIEPLAPIAPRYLLFSNRAPPRS